MDYVVYYFLLGFAKVRKIYKFTKDKLFPEPINAKIFHNDNKIENIENISVFSIPETAKYIITTKNKNNYIFCAKKYKLSYSLCSNEDGCREPPKYMEVVIVPKGIDIIKKYEQCVVDEHCCNRITWKDFLTIENIEHDESTKISLLDNDFNSIMITNLGENAF